MDYEAHICQLQMNLEFSTFELFNFSDFVFTFLINFFLDNFYYLIIILL